MSNIEEKVISFIMPDGVEIVASAYGDPDNHPVLLAHGGGQTRFSWGRTAQTLAEQGWYAIAYDHRGHGESAWCPNGNYALAHFAEDQRHIAESLDQKPIVVGASLGGLSAILAQGECKDELYKGIILVDIVPRMNAQGARDIIAFMLTHVEDGFGTPEEAAKVIAEYTHRPMRKDLSGLKKNLRLGDDGRYRWHWDPKFATMREEKVESETPERVVNASLQITQPILLVRGAKSDLVTEERAKEFLEMVPHAKYVDVAEARHMVAGDVNDIFTNAVLEFIRELDT